MNLLKHGHKQGQSCGVVSPLYVTHQVSGHYLNMQVEFEEEETFRTGLSTRAGATKLLDDKLQNDTESQETVDCLCEAVNNKVRLGRICFLLPRVPDTSPSSSREMMATP